MILNDDDEDMETTDFIREVFRKGQVHSTRNRRDSITKCMNVEEAKTVSRPSTKKYGNAFVSTAIYEILNSAPTVRKRNYMSQARMT